MYSSSTYQRPAGRHVPTLSAGTWFLGLPSGAWDDGRGFAAQARPTIPEQARFKGREGARRTMAHRAISGCRLRWGTGEARIITAWVVNPNAAIMRQVSAP